ncbi:single-stranded-DNA-specific exonuclease RecJ [Geomicrobium sp. JCM 19039]|uniref:single-stranded-DNA-specific exonuclease RecJ n=1 Tax=Geomicrobium sp. JCM 19039 TaxID=1460636 RepID=UPI00045F4C18|nr:single-stranded-DNA-specific exonuclease RecJ [Geomicrobium sp. JCM 19039]GAK11319.1 single-stranded-DNA-specific exonuclease RecJ [Geomicrobium sp. JCM 19039]
MLQANTKWQMKTQTMKADQLASVLGVSPLTAHLLMNRGCETKEKAEAFLHMNEDRMHDPFLLHGMKEAVDRIHKAVIDKEKIIVFGDYDVDGVSSTALMCETLQKLGAVYDWYIPNRFTEGYGPNVNAFQGLRDGGASLVITVDTGIAAVESVSFANEIGLDVIVTDHHEVGPELPDAKSIINPKKKNCSYPYKDLAGVGVVLKLSHALLGEVPKDGFDLVALGTISDLVPLVDENRYFAKRGLKQLGLQKRAGLRSLGEVSGLNGPPFSSQDVGFGLGPRLNAAGRMASAKPACELLMVKDTEEALVLAEQIDHLNQDRQETVERIAEEALKSVDQETDVDAVVVSGVGWNSGVTGIVASRLVEKFNRPAIVIAQDEHGVGKGSARSIPGFDLYDTLSEVRHLFTHFGGHPMAAGLTIDTTHIDELRRHMNKRVNETMTEEEFIPVTHIELSLTVSDVTIDLIREVEQLAPFGMGNPKPCVLIEESKIIDKRSIGAKKNHVKMQLADDDAQLDCIGFRKSYIDDQVSMSSSISVIGELETNEWRGKIKPQLILKDAQVNGYQLFDVRGKSLASLPADVARVVFTEEKKQQLQRLDTESTIIRADEADSTMPSTCALVELPDSLEEIEALLTQSSASVKNVYVAFQEEAVSYFMTVPSREEFKWYFAFIKQKGPISKNELTQLEKYKGWSEPMIKFMTNVFRELEFVTIENGLINIHHAPLKKDLKDAPTYMMHQTRVDAEKTLLLSSSEELKRWFDQQLKRKLPEREELLSGL